MVVVANDFQIPFHDEKALALFKLFLRRERSDWLILNGDFQDFWESSSFDLTPRTGKEFLWRCHRSESAGDRSESNGTRICNPRAASKR